VQAPAATLGPALREGVVFEPCALSIQEVAEPLVAGKSLVPRDMALRLSRVLGRSAESWLNVQDSHNLWQYRQSLDLSGLTVKIAPCRCQFHVIFA